MANKLENLALLGSLLLLLVLALKHNVEELDSPAVMVVVESPSWVLGHISSGSDVAPTVLAILLSAISPTSLRVSLSSQHR